MLSRVEEKLLMILAHDAGNGRGLDELRPCADHCEDFHAPTIMAGPHD